MIKLLLILIVFVIGNAQDIRLRPTSWAIEVVNSGLENLYKVSDQLYRSANPDDADIADLKALNIATVLNLRYYHSDEDDLENSGFTLARVKMKAHKVTENQVIDALRVILNSKGPTLVHCLHGSDRTGTVVAAYRIVVQGWSKQDAIDEMKNGNFGFHDMFKNLPILIQNLDVQKMRKELKID